MFRRPITSPGLRRPVVIAAALLLHGLAIYGLVSVRHPPEVPMAEATPLTLITVVPVLPETMRSSGVDSFHPHDLPPPALVLTPPTITIAPMENPMALSDYVRCGLPREFWLQDRERCTRLLAQVQSGPTPARIPSDREIQMVAKFERENAELHAPKRMPCVVRRAKGASARCGTEPTWRDEDF